MTAEKIGSFEFETQASVADAEEGVARAGAAFSASLRDVSLAGHETAERVGAIVRPVLIGVGLLATVLLAVRLLRGPRQARGFRRASARPTRSLWTELASAAALSLASASGRALAARWLASVPAPQERLSLPPSRHIEGTERSF